ncbi:MAG: TetR/AcrR family transcriptional regulator C-terminal domain-containing protein [Eubacterium sp.]|nr:TetR/AcrR family transcriptional regulator C-terminal domain-containing protein [Eubacterium sp.]
MNKNSPCAIRTKTKMAKAFKELMNAKPFDKITVSDITEKCKIHRQTFYYHFQDRYELLDWIILNELLEPFMNGFSLENMYDKFRTLLETMNNEKKFYQSAVRIDSGEVSTYLSRASKAQFVEVLRNLGAKNNIEPQTAENNMLIAEFFGYGLSGVVLSWVQRGMKESPEELTAKIANLIDVCKKIAKR